jgi:hypothetical protein
MKDLYGLYMMLSKLKYVNLENVLLVNNSDYGGFNWCDYFCMKDDGFWCARICSNFNNKTH